ncbi:MAG: DegT/DnrJ/EryC1/StrS aminotransferase family protein [Pseudomonadota bacterium]
MNINNIKNWPNFDEDEINKVVEVLRSGKINQWTGQEVTQFENEYSAYLGVEHAIALANGSVALDLALAVLGIGPGDEIIVTPRSFVASASCIALRGAIPIFVDVDQDTQNITLDSVKKAVTASTKVIIAVHLAGWPCELEELRQFCDDNHLFLVEDCAQAHGARYNGKPVGSFGDISVFSFCQDKIITTGGEGGLLVTSNKMIWEKAWSYKDHGKDYGRIFNKPNEVGFQWVVESFGTNYRLTEVQAAIGRIQLRKLSSWVDKRRKFAQMLNDAFCDSPVFRVTIPSDKYFHAYYRYYVFVRPENLKQSWSRNRIIKELVEVGIPCNSGSCPEVYMEAPFKRFCKERLAIAKELGETSIALLVHPTLEEDDINCVIGIVKDILNNATK